jgi:pimeloyl-ACP methyl ester carboxylesterase
MKQFHSAVLVSARLVLLLGEWITGGFNMAYAAEPSSKYIRQSAGVDTVIVFVHGIMGDSVSTWTSQSAYWPTLLTEDHTFDGSDVFVYSYPTGFVATFSIDELAEDMRRVLSANGVSAQRQIVFLSHSMGGLVTRAYLLKNREIAARTSFAYFLSTPTTGSQIASIAQFISDNPQFSKIKLMRPEDYLADLLRSWLAARFSFPSYCAYEKRPTYGVSLVVNMDSAVALCNRAVDPIDADHISIAKPGGDASASYIAFKAAYADAKIPDLKTLLDNKESIRLQSEIEEVARFPDGPDSSPPRALLETMVVNKLPHRLYGVLERYNRADILGVKNNGSLIYDYKKDYYEFQSMLVRWENDTTSMIGQRVSVRFRQAWTIYLRYMIMRFSGHTKESIIAGGDFLNYGITWDDAERVFDELSKEPSFHRAASELFTAQKKVFDEAIKIAWAR